MVAVVESITYLSNGNILQYGILTYRPDKFTFVTMAKKIKTTRKLRFYLNLIYRVFSFLFFNFKLTLLF